MDTTTITKNKLQIESNLPEQKNPSPWKPG